MKYEVWITLAGTYEADSEDDAFQNALDDIAERDGMEIVNHEVFNRDE